MFEIIMGIAVAAITFLVMVTIFISGLITGTMLLAKYIWDTIVDAGCDSE